MQTTTRRKVKVGNTIYYYISLIDIFVPALATTNHTSLVYDIIPHTVKYLAILSLACWHFAFPAFFYICSCISRLSYYILVPLITLTQYTIKYTHTHMIIIKKNIYIVVTIIIIYYNYIIKTIKYNIVLKLYNINKINSTTDLDQFIYRHM